MLDLKPLSKDAIPAALAKAERYRLLNEPMEAESICEDILTADPENHDALVTLLLARTDQFADGARPEAARSVLHRLAEEYERRYYAGIISERLAKAHLHFGRPASGFRAYEYFQDAMRWYEMAESLRPEGNDDARLRWNACARFLMRHPQLEPQPEERLEPIMME